MATSPSGQPVLSVQDLTVTFASEDGPVKAVDGISFDLFENQTLGIVGESGSGKSVSSMALLGLLPRSARVSGRVLFRGDSLLEKSDRELRALRGSKIAMVFQDALAALNPTQTVGTQIAEAITVHDDKIGGSALNKRVVDLLDGSDLGADE